ncbi:MAG: toll/interleukin-1 receptor domain-containing protein [Parvularculaceae bacterium]
MGPFKYRAFISYSWSDRVWGEWLHHALETYRTPPALIGKATALGPAPERLRPIFKDREEEAAAHSIGASIEAAMLASEFLIVLCSPRSAQSKWVNREVAFFKRNRDARKILTVIVDGEPGASTIAGREAEECFPKTLLFKVSEDFSPTLEAEDTPLAADAREGGDGKRGAKLKLAAAMLGLGLDDLIRRDEKRRTAVRRTWTAGLGLAAAGFAGLSIFAFTQRDAARAAREVAVAARAEAEFQRDEAQSLVEFMLTDLRERLDAVGRLDILDAVGERLLRSYAKQNLAALDPDALGRRARVLMLLGEIDSTRGRLDAALARYTEAAATTSELLRRDPDNAQRIFDHAQSVYWVGDIALKRGDMAKVTERWTEYRDFGLRLTELDPNKDEWRTELAYGHRNLASLAYDRGDTRNAIAGFRLAGEITGALAETNPGDRSLQLNHADDLQWLAGALERLGAFGEARNQLAEEAAIYESLLARDPANDAALRRQAVNRRVQARVAVARGDLAGGIAMLDSLFPVHERRLAEEPDNTRWLYYYGFLQIEAGGLRLASGDVGAADALALAAQGTGERLVSFDQSAADWLIDIYCGARLLSARVALAAGRSKNAQRALDEAAAAVGRISAAKDKYVLDQLGIKIDVLRARLAEQLDEEAVDLRISAETEAAIEAAWSKSGFENKTVFIEAWLLAGESAKAAALAAELSAAGYRHPDFLRLSTRLPKGGSPWRPTTDK